MDRIFQATIDVDYGNCLRMFEMFQSYVVQNYLSDLQAEYPSRIVANIGNIAFGLCHGHQVLPWGDERALAAMRRCVIVSLSCPKVTLPLLYICVWMRCIDSSSSSFLVYNLFL